MEGSAAETVTLGVSPEPLGDVLGKLRLLHHMLSPHPVGQLSLNTVMVIMGSSPVLPIYGECWQGSKIVAITFSVEPGWLQSGGAPALRALLWSLNIPVVLSLFFGINLPAGFPKPCLHFSMHTPAEPAPALS